MAWKFGISTIDYPYIDQNPKMKMLKIFYSMQKLKSPRVAYSYHTIPTPTFNSPRKWNIHTLSSTHCVAEVFPQYLWNVNNMVDGLHQFNSN